MLRKLFRFGKSDKGAYDGSRDEQRPTTAPTYTPSRPPPLPLAENIGPGFSPPQRRPQAPPPLVIPTRADNISPCSIKYDNGYGSLDAAVLRDAGLPAHIRTIDQLETYRKSRNREVYDSPSLYSPASVTSPSPLGKYLDAIGYSPSLLGEQRPTPHAPTSVVASAMQRRYAAEHSVGRILPGTTRKHKYEGTWLGQGSVRNNGIARKNTRRGRSKPASAVSAPPLVNHGETSGWY